MNTNRDIKVPHYAIKLGSDRIGSNARAVNQYDKDGKFIAEYPSMCAAGRAVSGNKRNAGANIGRVCNEPVCELSAYGFYWAYVVIDPFA